MKKPPRTYVFQEMLIMLETNPLTAALQAKRKNVTLTRCKYEISAVACGVYLVLRVNRDWLNSFYELDFWTNRTYKRNREHLLAHVHMYIYNSNEGSGAQRARAHATALAPYVDSDNPMRPADLPGFLEQHGGFDGLIALNSRDGEDDDKEEKLEPESVADEGSDDDEQVSVEGGDNRKMPAALTKKVVARVTDRKADVAKQAPASKKTAVQREEDPLKGMRRADIADHLLLRWSDEQREDLLKRDIGTEVTLTVTRLHDTKDGFAVFELLDFA